MVASHYILVCHKKDPRRCLPFLITQTVRSDTTRIALVLCPAGIVSLKTWPRLCLFGILNLRRAWRTQTKTLGVPPISSRGQNQVVQRNAALFFHLRRQNRPQSGLAISRVHPSLFAAIVLEPHGPTADKRQKERQLTFCSKALQNMGQEKQLYPIRIYLVCFCSCFLTEMKVVYITAPVRIVSLCRRRMLKDFSGLHLDRSTVLLTPQFRMRGPSLNLTIQ